MHSKLTVVGRSSVFSRLKKGRKSTVAEEMATGTCSRDVRHATVSTPVLLALYRYRATVRRKREAGKPIQLLPLFGLALLGSVFLLREFLHRPYAGWYGRSVCVSSIARYSIRCTFFVFIYVGVRVSE